MLVGDGVWVSREGAMEGVPRVRWAVPTIANRILGWHHLGRAERKLFGCNAFALWLNADSRKLDFCDPKFIVGRDIALRFALEFQGFSILLSDGTVEFWVLRSCFCAFVSQNSLPG